MRHFRRWLCFLLPVAVSSSAATCFAADGSATADRARHSIVIVSSNISEHRDAIGAGVVVALEPHRIRVVTARHVVDRGAVTVWVAGKPFGAEIVRTIAGSDLAVVDAVGQHLDRLQLAAASLAATTAHGNELFVWGEDQSGLRVLHGNVESPAYAAPDASGTAGLMSVVCDACAPGDSGGGIFDASGHLIGVLTARYFSGDNRTIAIVGERLTAALYELNDSPPDISATATHIR